MAANKDQSLALRDTDFDVNGTPIHVYARRPVVRELAARLMSLHPAAKEVGAEGMLAVAQTAVLIGANPLPGTNEIHVWKNKKGRTQIDLGINYFRRRARELGGIFWRRKPEQMTDDERKEYMIPDGQIACICEGCRQSDMKDLMAAGIAPNDIWTGVGELGIGTVGRDERAKEGRPLVWTGFKRCEKDIYRKLFPNLERPAPQRAPHEMEDWHVHLDSAQHDELRQLEQVSADIRAEIAESTPEEIQARLKANVDMMQAPEDFEGFDTPSKSETDRLDAELDERETERKAQIFDETEPEPEREDSEAAAVLEDGGHATREEGEKPAKPTSLEARQVALVLEVQRLVGSNFITLNNVMAALRQAYGAEEGETLELPDADAGAEWAQLADDAAEILKPD